MSDPHEYQPITNLDEAIRTAPVQLIGTGDGVLIVRGNREVRVSGESACEAVQLILTMGMEVTTRRQIRESFPEISRPAIDELIESLYSRRILIPVGDVSTALIESGKESELDIFYWNFDQKAENVTQSLSKVKVAIMGVNGITRSLAMALSASEMRNYDVVDYPLLRNLRLFNEEGRVRPDQWPLSVMPPLDYMQWRDDADFEKIDVLVAATDFGGRFLMREWNEFCVANGINYLPIVLEKMSGYIGPFVIPGETACYECLRARENSHIENPDQVRFAEKSAFQRQEVVGNLPSMASILGDIAAVELIKFYSGITSPKVGRLIHVNLFTTEMISRKVLVVPRCSVCSPACTLPKNNTEKTINLPGNVLVKDLMLNESH